MQASSGTSEIFRIFVGSLSYEVDKNRLRECFKQYGNIKKALVIRDQKTGQSKGYGFITFSCRSSFEAAMENPTYVNGRVADCHPVMTKGALKEQEQRDLSNKLFVGGISQSTKSEDLHHYFSRFGRIREARVLYDGKTGKSRGFGFILFEKDAAVDQVFTIQEHKIKKKIVEIKRFSKETRATCQGSDTYDYDSQAYSPQESSRQENRPTKGEKKAAPGKKNKNTKKVAIAAPSSSSEKEKETQASGSFTETKFTSPKPNHISEEDTCQDLSDYDHLYEEERYPDSKPNFTLSGFFSNSSAQNYQYGGFSSSLRRDSFTMYQGSDQNFGKSSMQNPISINIHRQASLPWHPSEQQSQSCSRSSIPVACRQF